MIDFSTGVPIGTKVSEGSRSWVWNGTGWAKQLNNGQTVATFSMPGTILTVVAAIPSIGNGFQQINYL